ncbi:endoplasmic reticulum resident protein 27 isoform X2 [Callorhinchus milii]|uniref:endoplasmic reticulum resident protein 27 isoform X2 n=1 Tax=Callorhinchus milii TaxID=7868 RepID=UPI001C3F5519|nr:endoplasmic reticulum resident protein 27 isoform X2 [Callorhinchus milii]
MLSCRVLLYLLLHLTLSLVQAQEEVEVQDVDENGEVNTRMKNPLFGKPKHKKDDSRTVNVLKDIATTEEFINSSDVTIMGFIKDLKSKEADIFHEVVKNVRALSFGLTPSEVVWKKYNVTESTISIFKKYDEKRADYELGVITGMTAAKVVEFVNVNEMRLVTEYNDHNAIQIFGSHIPVHILLIVNKSAPEYPTLLEIFTTVARDYRGTMIFIHVDTDMKSNIRVMAFFSLKHENLPSVCLYNTLTDDVVIMRAGEISAFRIRGFCNEYIGVKPRQMPIRRAPEEL